VAEGADVIGDLCCVIDRVEDQMVVDGHLLEARCPVACSRPLVLMTRPIAA
jgi:hypothetical protein